MGPGPQGGSGRFSKTLSDEATSKVYPVLKGVKAETEKQEKDGVQIARYFIVSKPH